MRKRTTQVEAARWLLIVLLGVFAFFWMWVILHGAVGPPGEDVRRVHDAALRLRAGQDLYVNTGDPNRFYTWGPWLAWLWVPLTYLPESAVAGIWLAICFASWAFALWPARHSLPLLLLIAPLTFYGAWVGNPQAPLVALLVVATPTRWGAAAVGIAAALKASPIFFALVWARNKEWRKVATAVGVAVLLGAPAIFSGIDHYPFGLDPQSSLRAVSDLVWVVATLIAVVLVFVVRTRMQAWVASGGAVVVSQPSLLLYDVGYLLVPLAVLVQRTGSMGGPTKHD